MARNKKQIDLVLVSALAKGATNSQAGQQAGVSERTVYRRLQNPEFQARIDALQDETLQRAAAVLTAAAQEGIRSLVTLQEPATPPSVRRAAARDILEMGLRLRAVADLEKRLVALEQTDSQNGACAAQGVVCAPARSKRRRRGDAALQLALAMGSSVSQAARKASLSERTAYRRLDDADFQKGIEALRAQMVQRAAALLVAATMLAAKTLVDLQNAVTPASVRRRAARDIIEMGNRLRQATVLEKRLAAIESQAHLPT